MVQFPNFRKLGMESESHGVKLEFEDYLEEEHAPFNKKSKQWDENAGMVLQSVQSNLLAEPSPLGLRLRKSPSLVDLIQMRLSQGNSATPSFNGGLGAGKKDMKPNLGPGVATDKLKASNFPADILKIGTWECRSRYEGDLVAKCYYAKHKLVWEVLDGGLKSKIEIQWSDITALKAIAPENAPGTLEIVLARQPLFFRETNPQPRKHTLWQATSDFTNGQASIHRRHFLQCPPGLLSKHFEKLIQCDPHLNTLSRQPEIILECPFFDTRPSVFEDHDDSKCHSSIMLVPPCSAPSISTQNEMRVPTASTLYNGPLETFSHNTVMDAQNIEEIPTAITTYDSGNPIPRWDQIKVPGLQSSMSVSDLVNHLEHCISGQTTPGNPLIPTDSSLDRSKLEVITNLLLGDCQLGSAHDEEVLLSRVDSYCHLIEADKNSSFHVSDEKNEFDNENKGFNLSRNESHGELLDLPRIASLPYLFKIAEDY